MSLQIGTNRYTLITSSVVTSSANPWNQARETRVPSGVQHAVRAGRRVALCGRSPAHIWTDLSWPGAGGELCLDCEQIAASSAAMRPAQGLGES